MSHIPDYSMWSPKRDFVVKRSRQGHGSRIILIGSGNTKCLWTPNVATASSHYMHCTVLRNKYSERRAEEISIRKKVNGRERF
jgi:hypothetical protein